ncbi:hypothetical protein HYH03_000139 [Edaphochlamys debaryana]|uniref:Protein kinase domain-containing protein n=1 Tax=Edaphochlamys debaryana TaxID=47281 RepID=A0A835YPT2_9CHLO|nr:hypothetical protein HYH03_000139 [Edaphochlamys debaryana]|eukprot:KAG2501634.1 hypothetical protein HYH03_000139 [Edaphochlamys debaryana]
MRKQGNHVSSAQAELSPQPSFADVSLRDWTTSSADTVPDCWDELEPAPELCRPGMTVPEGFVVVIQPPAPSCSVKKAPINLVQLPHSPMDPDGYMWYNGLREVQFLSEKPFTKGTFGEVFRVWVPLPDGRVQSAALKLLQPGASTFGFANEVDTLKRMWGASGSLQLLAASAEFTYKGTRRPALLLEYCDGGSLANLMDIRARQLGIAHGSVLLFDEASLRLVMRQLLEALHEVHEAQMIHLDLKPENLLFKGEQLKIADFGCAVMRSRRTGHFETEGGGTLLYMAKEVTASKRGVPTAHGVTEKADVFSAGCVLAEMAFLHDQPIEFYAFSRQMEYPLPDFVPPELLAYLRLLTDPDPRRRPSAAQALQHEWLQQ